MDGGYIVGTLGGHGRTQGHGRTPGEHQRGDTGMGVTLGGHGKVTPSAIAGRQGGTRRGRGDTTGHREGRPGGTVGTARG